MGSIFQNLKRYVHFSDQDAESLRALLERARPYFQSFASNFYDRISEHPDAFRVLEGPEQVARLKMTLMKWMRTGLKGPHDEEFFRLRSRIGRMHVRIGLPQQYMFTAMNVMRLDFHDMIAEVYRDEPERERLTRNALDKLFDLELAIMLRTYQDDSEERMRRHVRMSTIGQVAASIGRELQGPLNALRVCAGDVYQQLSAANLKTLDIEQIEEHADTCDRIIDTLIQLDEQRPLQRRRVAVRDLLAAARASVQVPVSIRVEIECPADLQTHAEPELVCQAVGELLAHVIDACEGDGVIVLAAHADDAGVAIDVGPRGPGFDTGFITEAFSSESSIANGAFHLERVIIQSIATRHNGSVFATTTADGGVAVRLQLAT